VEDPEEEDEQQAKLNLRLHRRDTPHHLKNKRINADASDTDTLQAILSRVRIFVLYFLSSKDILKG